MTTLCTRALGGATLASCGFEVEQPGAALGTWPLPRRTEGLPGRGRRGRVEGHGARRGRKVVVVHSLLPRPRRVCNHSQELSGLQAVMKLCAGPSVVSGMERMVLCLLLCVFGLLIGCQREFIDDACYGDPPGPVGTSPYVGLFHRDGRPAFGRARVWISYAGREVELGVDPQIAAELLPNGQQTTYLAVPPQRAGNLYTFAQGGSRIALYPCALPIHYRVEADGCTRVEGVWSWNDNTRSGRRDRDFHVPVRLDCTGEDLLPDASSPVDAAAP